MTSGSSILYRHGRGGFYAYRRGDIIRASDTWGVVVSVGHFATLIDWWTGQYSADTVEQWCKVQTGASVEIGAPFSVDYTGIPPEVRARAAYYLMVAE